MLVPCAPSSRYTLLFLHGNAWTWARCATSTSVWAHSSTATSPTTHSGYGVSSGKPLQEEPHRRHRLCVAGAAHPERSASMKCTKLSCLPPSNIFLLSVTACDELAADTSSSGCALVSYHHWSMDCHVRQKSREHHLVWSEHGDGPHGRPGLQVRVCCRDSPLASDVWVACVFSRQQENVLLWRLPRHWQDLQSHLSHVSYSWHRGWCHWLLPRPGHVRALSPGHGATRGRTSRA